MPDPIDRSTVPGLTVCSLCSGETLGDADERGQLDRIAALAGSGVARVTYVECLDLCERGDIVVARPCRAAREATAAGPVAFERLAGQERTGELARWLADGGPGVAGVPPALRELVVERDAESTTAA